MEYDNASSLLAEPSGVRWKRISKHGVAALGLLPCRLVLDDIPVIDQKAVLDTKVTILASAQIGPV